MVLWGQHVVMQTATGVDRPVMAERGMTTLLTMSALGFSGFALLLPVGPLWVAHGGSSEAGGGMVTAVLLLSTVLAQMLVPNALRRFGWRPLLVGGMLLLGAPAVLFILSDQLWWVLVLSAVRGSGFAVLTVCGSGAVAALIDKPRHGRAAGLYGLAIAAPQVVLVPSAGWLAETVSFSLVFVLAAVPVAAVFFARRLGGVLDELPELVDDPAEAGAAPPLRRVLITLAMPSIILLAVTAPGGALLSFAPQFASARTSMIGLLGLTGAAAIARWGAGSFADRYGSRVFMAPLLLACAAGLALSAWGIREDDSSAVLLIVGMTIVGVAYGSLQNLTLVAAFAAVSARDRNTASAVWNIGFDAGTGLGSLLVGAIATGANFSVALLVPAALSIAVAAAALCWRR